MADDLRKESSNAERPLVSLTPADRLIIKEESTGLEPSSVAAILTDADKGNFNRLAKLASELEEKDWDIGQALQIRTAKVKSTVWDVVQAGTGKGRKNIREDPPARDATAEKIASWVKDTVSAIPGNPDLGLVDFDQCLEDGLHAYLPGIGVSEIVWEAGGAGVHGFQFVPAFHFTYWQSLRPRLITPEHRQDGEELPEKRFIIHRHLPRGGDATRGGLIRPLAWVYIFKNILVKQMMRFGEKFGMPWVAAQIESGDEKVFDREANRIKHVIQNFGSDGGGIFSKSTELEFKVPQGGAARAGEFFFTGINYFKRAINKVLLGQTSTSDSEDSNRSVADVHNEVRLDLAVDDCHDLAKTIKQQLFAPLVANQFGPDAPVPDLDFDVYSWMDLKALAEFLKTAKEAGFELEDENELSKRAGMKFKKHEPLPMPGIPGAPGDNGNGKPPVDANKPKEEVPADA